MTAEGFRERITDGTAQARRRARALAPGYFRPEDRSLAAHLARTATQAAAIRFFDESGSPSGTWAKLFAEEPAAILADLLALSPEDARADFAEALDRDPAAAARALQALARRVHFWLDRAATRGRARFGAQLEGMRERDDPFALAAALATADRADPALLARLAQETGHASPVPGQAVARARAARQTLVQAHDQLLNIVATLRPNAETALEVRLASGEIDPALGLILTQIGLLRDVAEVANRFPDRHARYYYGEVLGLAPRSATPEAAHLSIAGGPAPLVIPAGSELRARVEGRPEPLRYRLPEALRVAPVRVAEAHGLRYARDPLISPQSELGFVTGVSARRIDLVANGAADGAGAPRSRVFAHAGARSAELGLAVASPLLSLSGGTRRVELRLCLDRRMPPEPDTPLTTPDATRRAYGNALAATLIEGAPWPEGVARDALLAAIATHLGGAEAAQVAAEMFAQPRAEVFQTLLRDAFELELSSEAGPIAPGAVLVAPNPDAAGPGLALGFTLAESDPAIVAPPGEVSPVVTIRLAPHGRFCPVSLLEPYALTAIAVAVDVAGLTRITAFSDDGPLSVTQPFMPFGARPRDGAVFLAGAPELASKPVTRVGLDITWADLPRTPGGFEDHYRSYGPGFAPPDPRLGLAYLTADGWKEIAAGPVEMARRSSPGGPLRAHRRLEGQVPGRAVAARSGVDREAFRQRQTIRAGLVRLTLACGPDGFGHDGYPAVLAEAMRPTLARWRRRPLPPPPVTPQIAALSLDYSAEGRIELGTPQEARPGERVVQIGPFGRAEIFPRGARPGAGVLPPRIADGSLFLRIAGAAATGPVSLLFEMQQASHRRKSFRPVPVSWHYLTAAGWQPLPSWSLGTDTTEGLMRTGVVTIDVPDQDVVVSGGEMPGEGVWLAVSANDHIDAFPRLASVSVNGARVERFGEIGTEEAGDATGRGEAPRRWSVHPPIAGIGKITQVGTLLGGAAAESETAFRTRAAEGLRHRQRAVTAWDIERIVLDRFPEVWKVKCLPAGSGGGPGEMCVVVVPFAPEDSDRDPARPAMFDVLSLRRIEAALDACSSAFAAPRVRNPSYERLQIRARVGFAEGGDTGLALRQLKRDLSRFLSVWTGAAPLDGFGWSLNLHDVAAFVRGLDYVRFLTGFSILHLTRDDHDLWRLHDTARESAASAAAGDEAGNGRQILKAREPWSLVLPMADHWITTPALDTPEAARPTGIGGLGIGETLVVETADGA